MHSFNTLMKNCCLPIRQRWVFAVMCFFGLFNAYAMRACLSITLTEMVPLSEPVDNLDSTCQSNIRNITHTNSTQSSKKVYQWNEKTQGLILSSFYWTYVISHLPGGIIAEKYGGKHTLGTGILMSALFTLLTPISITWAEEYGLIIIRVFIGLGQGVSYPAINVLLSQWAPPSERSRIASLVYAAQSLGTVFASSASGLIIYYTDRVSNVFYIIGGISVAWYLLWLILCYNNPREHPFISDAELKHLNERLNDRQDEKLPAIPWREIIKSKAVWAAMISMIGFDWITLTIMTDLPKYASSVLKIPVKDNGYLNSLVFLSMCVGSAITSWLADYTIKRKFFSTTNVRKIGSVLCIIFPACFVMAASYAGCDPVLVTVMFTLAIGLTGAAFPSIMINPLDISRNYSGTITAFSNGLSTGISGILSPYLIGVMTPNQTLYEWRLMFWIMFIISVATNVFFLLFGKGKAEYWDDLHFRERQKKNKNLESSTSKNIQ